jgi:hypothetical protein
LFSNQLFHRLGRPVFDAKKRSAASAAERYARWMASERTRAIEIDRLIDFRNEDAIGLEAMLSSRRGRHA